MHIIRQKIMAATNAIKPDGTKGGKKLMFFLPEAEMNDIGLLLANYMARVRQHHVTYLGPNVAFEMLRKYMKYTSRYPAVYFSPAIQPHLKKFQNI